MIWEKRIGISGISFVLRKGGRKHFAARGTQIYLGLFQDCANSKPRLEVARMSWSKVSTSFMKTITVFFALFTLVSCIAAPRTEFMGPNGKMVYAISCQTMDDCMTEARELCPSGHDIVPAASGAGDTTARGGIGDTPAKRLLIECKVP